MTHAYEWDGVFRKCPVCDKRFWIGAPELWAYKSYTYQKKGLAYYCSWTCLRKAEKNHAVGKTARKTGAVNDKDETVLDRTTVLYLIKQTGKPLWRLSLESGHGRGWLSRLTAHEPVRIQKKNLEALADVLECDQALLIKKEKQ